MKTEGCFTGLSDENQPRGHTVDSAHLVHLVGGAVLPHSDRDGGLVRQRYAQLHVRHSVVVLRGERRHDDDALVPSAVGTRACFPRSATSEPAGDKTPQTQRFLLETLMRSNPFLLDFLLLLLLCLRSVGG